MAATNLFTVIFIIILAVLLTFYPKKKGFNDGEILIEVSDFVLAKHWEAGRTDICIYGLSAFVYSGGFPAATSNRNMKVFKTLSKCKIPHQNSPSKALTLYMILLLSGDIATNPGPIRYPCGTCAKTVRSNQHALQCDGCDSWNHRACLDMSKDEYFLLSTSDDYWFCRNCILPNFTDSFFSCEKSIASESSFISLDNSRSIQTHDSIDSPQNESTSEEPCDIFKDLRELRKGNSKKPIMCHLNINSLRYKFNDLKPILTDKLCDILIISETKLDDSFNDNLFVINGYKFERKDRNAKGGGLFVYYRGCD